MPFLWHLQTQNWSTVQFTINVWIALKIVILVNFEAKWSTFRFFRKRFYGATWVLQIVLLIENGEDIEMCYCSLVAKPVGFFQLLMIVKNLFILLLGPLVKVAPDPRFLKIWPTAPSLPCHPLLILKIQIQPPWRRSGGGVGGGGWKPPPPP